MSGTNAVRSRAEGKRKQRPSVREVSSVTGSRFRLVGHRRGYPLPDAYMQEIIWIPAALALVVESRRWVLHSFRYRKAWLVNIARLDDRGFPTGDTRNILAESESQATVIMTELTRLLERDGLAAVDAEIASGRYRTSPHSPDGVR